VQWDRHLGSEDSAPTPALSEALDRMVSRLTLAV